MPMRPSSRWDIFCAVVDNYGDAGIAWRLARCLSAVYGVPVRLYVDALGTLACLVPGVDASRDRQRHCGVEIRAWRGPKVDLPGLRPGAVVIEAFGCGLPPSYLSAMAARDRAPVWINLEYLSAEAWIEDCHGLASRHPALPVTRYFFFPGFTPASGGLLRERDLLARRGRFCADARARATLWRRLGVAPPEGALVVSLFCYPDAPVDALLATWAHGEERIFCIVPDGVAQAQIERWTGGARALSRGSLTLARVPFVAQDDYDLILWTCGLNFVRGEDSFVRAQWAALPFVWQVYPQSEDAHRLKLAAFLERYTAGLKSEAAAAIVDVSRAWNGAGDVGPSWKRLLRFRATLEEHAGAWAAKLALQEDLASALVSFCRDRL
jgi:uncharacterized repeat protein (TIGR03837 family)